ncbi:LD-carboxypeptidase [Parvularcula maris]|uniref:LD-carboxypeptidase n=1 Tax=Parvularcula maris TaxID=2965077 RepID=A0A9X2LAB8_9PROT|nr:LD-carboxypeptidase [Parvularcula maris]MCQ8185814.1 LD-carboxypeptidase [Parvularcula maris]
MTHIRVVAPSRMLPREAAERAAELAAGVSGVTLRFDDQCFLSEGHFAGSDQERAAAFIRAANDPEVDAVWFARGGYGACRILTPVLEGLEESARSKTYLGYSDGGYLLGALGAAGFGKCVHGPMVADLLREGGEEAVGRVLSFFAGDSQERPVAYAFNLAVLSSLVATDHCPDFAGEAVMIEEVGEHLYAIDRMLFTVFASGALRGASGVMLGRVSEVPENDIAFGEEPEAILHRWCRRYGVPYLGSAPIGHDADNELIAFPSVPSV